MRHITELKLLLTRARLLLCKTHSLSRHTHTTYKNKLIRRKVETKQLNHTVDRWGASHAPSATTTFWMHHKHQSTHANSNAHTLLRKNGSVEEQGESVISTAHKPDTYIQTSTLFHSYSLWIEMEKGLTVLRSNRVIMITQRSHALEHASTGCACKTNTHLCTFTSPGQPTYTAAITIHHPPLLTFSSSQPPGLYSSHVICNITLTSL